jgi:hypothetical protein
MIDVLTKLDRAGAMRIRHDRSYLDCNDISSERYIDLNSRKENSRLTSPPRLAAVKEMRSVTKKRDLVGEQFTSVFTAPPLFEVISF